MTQKLTQAVVDLREADALAMVDQALADGTDPVAILADCKAAMDMIGDRFAAGEAFIPELIMAGEIMSGVSAKLKPHLTSVAPDKKLGVVVIGTVQGDIHDIGKDIVVTMLDIAGFDVVDLGVDVKIDTFIATAQEKEAQVIAMSCLLTSAIESMKQVVTAARDADMNGCKLMIGGAPITEQVVAYTGADGYGKDAVEAVELARQWIGGN